MREPLGPVAVLIPWDSSLISTALKLAPALATGNTVVLKPSELAAASVVEFARRTADLEPDGVISVVTGFGPAAGAALVRSAAVSEIFGPVLVVESWRDEQDAIARANDTDYSLAAGVWTSDPGRAQRIAGELEAGTVWVNTWFDVPIGQPLGGIKHSGYGRELCAETLLEYSATKAMSTRLLRERPQLWG